MLAGSTTNWVALFSAVVFVADNEAGSAAADSSAGTSGDTAGLRGLRISE
jgi:hypothetical protein